MCWCCCALRGGGGVGRVWAVARVYVCVSLRTHITHHHHYHRRATRRKGPSPMAIAIDPLLGSHWGVQRCSSLSFHPHLLSSFPTIQYTLYCTVHTQGEVKAIKNPRRPVNRPALGVSTPSHTQLQCTVLNSLSLSPLQSHLFITQFRDAIF
jgi:hypothetical protein